MDYRAMYLKLFNALTAAISILQTAQQETETMYVSAPEADIRILDTGKRNEPTE